MTYAKIELKAELELLSGLHIGGSTAFASIGAVDSPVIKDPLTNRPIIPGSSIKGKMRSLLARSLNESVACDTKDDNDKIKQLFGATLPEIIPSRLIFSDLIMTEKEEKSLKERGARQLTEVKFENSINRISAVANPRQIERVIAGSKFEFSLIYERAQKNNKPGEEVEFLEDSEVVEDFEIILHGLQLLEYDYLGGSGTRGYGKVKFREAKMKVVVGELNPDLESKLNDVLSAL
jgi:CRISPR-associated protein Csm3